jgi:hypothetical protein
VQVDRHVGERHQHALGIVGDQPGRRAAALAGEGAVEVHLVDRRDAPRRDISREVEAGDDDHPALQLADIERAHQVHERDRPLVLVAVVGAGQEQGGALAPLRHIDRDRDVAVGRAVVRMRQAERAGLHALLVVVDGGNDQRCGVHARALRGAD